MQTKEEASEKKKMQKTWKASANANWTWAAGSSRRDEDDAAATAVKKVAEPVAVAHEAEAGHVVVADVNLMPLQRNEDSCSSRRSRGN